MIQLNSISKSFGKKRVIENFSLSVKKGERIAIISYSGSGKTTLFRIIAGLEKHFNGERKVKGKVALMFQEDRLFENSTVIENVMAVSDKSSDEALSLLEDLGLKDSINLYPSDLSGGMKRRVALARALFFDADILLLDEAFTGLDPDTAENTARVINEKTKDKTLLLVTHRKEEARLLSCEMKVFEKGFIQ